MIVELSLKYKVDIKEEDKIAISDAISQGDEQFLFELFGVGWNVPTEVCLLEGETILALKESTGIGSVY